MIGKYYNVVFNDEKVDLIQIRKKYTEPKQFIYNCLWDALEYSIRFGKKYVLKEDLLKELDKIEFQLKQACEVINKEKEKKKKTIIYKIKHFLHIKDKQRFLIEVSKDYFFNKLTIDDFCVDLLKEQSLDIVDLIKNILYLDCTEALTQVEKIKKEYENKQ